MRALGGDGDGVLHTGSGLDIRASSVKDKLKPAKVVLRSSRTRMGGREGDAGARTEVFVCEDGGKPRTRLAADPSKV